MLRTRGYAKFHISEQIITQILHCLLSLIMVNILKNVSIRISNYPLLRIRQISSLMISSTWKTTGDFEGSSFGGEIAFSHEKK